MKKFWFFLLSYNRARTWNKTLESGTKWTLSATWRLQRGPGKLHYDDVHPAFMIMKDFYPIIPKIGYTFSQLSEWLCIKWRMLESRNAICTFYPCSHISDWFISIPLCRVNRFRHAGKVPNGNRPSNPLLSEPDLLCGLRNDVPDITMCLCGPLAKGQVEGGGGRGGD